MLYRQEIHTTGGGMDLHISHEHTAGSLIVANHIARIAFRVLEHEELSTDSGLIIPSTDETFNFLTEHAKEIDADTISWPISTELCDNLDELVESVVTSGREIMNEGFQRIEGYANAPQSDQHLQAFQEIAVKLHNHDMPAARIGAAKTDLRIGNYL